MRVFGIDCGTEFTGWGVVEMDHEARNPCLVHCAAGTIRLSKKEKTPQRLAQVYATAVETLGDGDKAADWLKTPNRALRGGRPLDQLDTDPGVREVEDVLGRIAYGVYS